MHNIHLSFYMISISDNIMQGNYVSLKTVFPPSTGTIFTEHIIIEYALYIYIYYNIISNGVCLYLVFYPAKVQLRVCLTKIKLVMFISIDNV